MKEGNISLIWLPYLGLIFLTICCAYVYSSDPASPRTVVCDAGWTLYNGYCYQILDLGSFYGGGTWMDNHELCEARNSRSHFIIEKDNAKLKSLLDTEVIPTYYYYDYYTPLYIFIGATKFDGPPNWINGDSLTWPLCTPGDISYDSTRTGDCIKLAVSVLDVNKLCIAYVDCTHIDAGTILSVAICQYFADDFSSSCPPSTHWLAGPDGQSCFYFQKSSPSNPHTSWDETYCRSIFSLSGSHTANGSIGELAVIENMMEMLWVRQHVKVALAGTGSGVSARVGLTSLYASNWTWIDGSARQTYLIDDPNLVPPPGNKCSGLIYDYYTHATPLRMYLHLVACDNEANRPYIYSYRKNSLLYKPIFHHVTIATNSSDDCFYLSELSASNSSCVTGNSTHIGFDNCTFSDLLPTTTFLSTTTTTIPAPTTLSKTSNPTTTRATSTTSIPTTTTSIPTTAPSTVASTSTTRTTSTTSIPTTTTSIPTTTPSTVASTSTTRTTSTTSIPTTTTSIPKQPIPTLPTACGIHGTLNCSCYNGFSGRLCEIEVDHCNDFISGLSNFTLSHACSVHGTCESTMGGIICHCNKGFQGPLCQITVNDTMIESKRCALHSSNLTVSNNISVGCPLNQRCLTDNLDCAFQTCINPVGWCVPEARALSRIKYHQQLKSKNPYSLDSQLNNPVVAASSQCNNHGFADCLCDHGFTGSSCDVEIDYCTEVITPMMDNPFYTGVCGQHGTCVTAISGLTCICEHGYTGRFCETASPNETFCGIRCNLLNANGTENCPGNQRCLSDNLDCAFGHCDDGIGWCLPL